MPRLPPWWRPVAYGILCVTSGWLLWQRGTHARDEFDDPARADGNSGHAQIDFGGQYVMGRMFVADGRHLYRRGFQRPVVEAAFPAEAGAPAAVRPDADALMGWFVGEGDGVGGPLYPPVHGLLYAPLALLPPQPAYRLFQVLSLGIAVFAAVAAGRASGVWVPLVLPGVLLFPGGRAGLDLGQNHMLTLAILTGGWWAMTRGGWVLGGAVWGLLAFKPVWAVAFLPALVLMGRLRAAVAMCGLAGGLIVLTLPVVGVGAWLDWLGVGREAAVVYGVNENWVGFSRDLAGLPRRPLLDFARPEAERHDRLAAGLGWGLWALVVAATAAVYRLQRDRRPVGPAAGFLLLGAYLSCYRFMYYDAVLATLPLALLVAGRAWRVPLAVWVLLVLYDNWLLHLAPELTLRVGATGGRFATDLPGRRVLTLAAGYRYPWDTAGLLVVWAWAGWRLLRHPAEGVEGGPDVRRPHQRLADQRGGHPGGL